jgi:GntR family transcriptional repressor for pyruvate dehydrogenase complex
MRSASARTTSCSCTLRSCYRLLSGVFQNRLLVFSVPGARDALPSTGRSTRQSRPATRRGPVAAMDHMIYVERSMAEAERSGDWRVSRLRLKQRVDTTDTEPARKRS